MAKDMLAALDAEETLMAVRHGARTEGGSDAAGSASTGASVVVGDTFTGRIGTAGDSDWVAIELVAGQTYVFTVYGSGGPGGLRDTILTVRDVNGTQFAINDDADAQFNLLFSLVSFTPTTSGTYYLDVAGFGSSTGQYTLRTATDVFTIEQVASQLTDMGWGIAPAPLRFDITANGSLTVNLTALTPEGQELARMALETWAQYTGITFVEVSSGTADIVFDDSSSGAFAGPREINPDTGVYGSANVNIGTEWLANYGTTYGSYSYLTYLHEIGHALGLGHAGNYDGAASYGVNNHYLNDSYQMTIMSYFSVVQNTFVEGTDFSPITPMAGDIAAMQYLYGQSASVFAGNTVWGANSNIPGNLGTAMRVMFEGAARPAWMDPTTVFGLTIVDAGGIDTMDFSRTGASQVIDMRAGGISDVYGNVGTVVVALGTTIENAVGGTGADRIIGNDANNFVQSRAGSDVVETGRGNDTVYAFDGNDSVLAGDGHDEVWGGQGDDTLRGEAGNDTIGGAGGNDSLDGGGGLNELWAGGGRDTVVGGTDADQLGGGAGNDSLRGGLGDDTIYGGTENDIIYGDADDDFIWAGPGSDTVYGGTGNDSISAGGGSDTIAGDAGADAFIFYRNYNSTVISDFDPGEGDRLHLARWMWQSQFGTLTPEQVENTFASLDGNGNVILDFGGANTRIVLTGFTDIESLDQYITIIS